MTAPAAMPSREQVEAEILPMTYEGADLTECVERVLALFAPILAEKEREIDGLLVRHEGDLAFASSRILEAEARALAAEAALAAERERCAKIAYHWIIAQPEYGTFSAEYCDGYSDGSDATQAAIAAAIRAQGE